jgi:hypothetical protein
MCVLCGALLTEAHWSERGGDEWPDEHNGTLTQEQAAARHHGRLRDRRMRVVLVNRLLAPWGVRLQDWQGSSYLLRSSRGRTAVVRDWAELWRAAEQMTGRPLDPLDPQLLAALHAGVHDEH